MAWMRLSMASVALMTLTACGVADTYPGRTEVQFMSNDQATLRTYACVPGDTDRQTQSRAASAHRYVDRAIASARSRLTAQSSGGIGASLGVQAELNAEIAQISRQSEAEYRCALVSSRNANSPFN